METKSDEMDPKEARFCVLRACGHSQSDAYRFAWDCKRAKPESVHRMAHRIAQRVHVKSRIRELLRQARVEDVLSVGEHMAHILEDRLAAKADRNHTAVAANNRTLATILGMTSNTLVLAAEKSETDEQLTTRLSGGDAHKAEMLRAIIGKDSFA